MSWHGAYLHLNQNHRPDRERENWPLTSSCRGWNESNYKDYTLYLSEKLNEYCDCPHLHLRVGAYHYWV